MGVHDTFSIIDHNTNTLEHDFAAKQGMPHPQRNLWSKENYSKEAS
jgi:hypothetical protein